MPDQESVLFDTVQLEMMKFCLLQKLQQEDFAIPPCVDFNESVERWAESIYVRVIVEVLGQPLDPVVIKHPLDWWQAVKHRFAPQWFLKRWPVKLLVNQVDFRVLYPSLPEIPGHTRYVNVCVKRETE